MTTSTESTVRELDDAREPYKLVARYKKAKAIAHLLLANGATASSAAVLGAIDIGRSLAALAAGQHTPSEVTWALVVEMVREVRP